MSPSPSLLWRDPEHRTVAQPAPETVSDLNLDRVFAEVAVAGSAVDQLLRAPLLHSEDVDYRRQVFTDLAEPSVRAQLERFSRSMSLVRRHLSELPLVRHPVVRRRLGVDIVHVYCRSVSTLHRGLSESTLHSPALESWRTYLNSYISGAEFQQLCSGCEEILADLAEIRYSMQIDEHRIAVEPAAEITGYTATIDRLFAPFTQGWAPTEKPTSPPFAGVHPVEERVLDELVHLFPRAFHRMMDGAEFDEFIDPVLDRLDGESQCYLSFLRLTDRLSANGSVFCLPEVTDSFDGIRVTGAYDVALAVKNCGETGPPVTNDYHLSGSERTIVVTGPNQGGKSTFARMFGQVTYLAALGCPVPARGARVLLADTIATHFERRERSDDAAGKLEGELTAIGETLAHATDRTLIILNESFSSTATADAQQIGARVLRKIMERKAVAVFVTFLDELSDLDGAVSMVAGVGADPTLRTFKVERKPADGRAHAVALAEQFELSYDAIVGRVTR